MHSRDAFTAGLTPNRRRLHPILPSLLRIVAVRRRHLHGRGAADLAQPENGSSSTRHVPLSRRKGHDGSSFAPMTTSRCSPISWATSPNVVSFWRSTETATSPRGRSPGRPRCRGSRDAPCSSRSFGDTVAAGHAELWGSSLDARAVYAVASDTLGVPPGRIALYGYSLGSAIATELARDVSPKCLFSWHPSHRRARWRTVSHPAVACSIGQDSPGPHYDTEAIVRSFETPVGSLTECGRRDTCRHGPACIRHRKDAGGAAPPRAASHNDVVTRARSLLAWLARALGTSSGRD